MRQTFRIHTFFAEAGIFGNPRNMNWKWWDTPRIYSSLSFSHLQKYGNTDVGIGINLLTDNGYRKYNDESLIRMNLRLKHHNEKVKGLVYGLNINSGYTVKTDFVLWEDATYGALKQDTSYCFPASRDVSYRGSIHFISRTPANSHMTCVPDFSCQITNSLSGLKTIQTDILSIPNTRCITM